MGRWLKQRKRHPAEESLQLPASQRHFELLAERSPTARLRLRRAGAQQPGYGAVQPGGVEGNEARGHGVVGR